METVYRTLLLKYDLLKLPPEVVEKISKLLELQEGFRRWAAEWAKSGGFLPPPEHGPLKYFAKRFAETLDWLKGMKKSGIKVKEIRPPLIFDVQLRLQDKERDVSRSIFVDLPKRQIRIRKWSGQHGNTIVLPLKESDAKWILERMREGGRLVLGAVWIGASRRSRAAGLHIALVFRREVAAMQPRRLLVIDFNALHNGLVWAVVEGERVVTKGILRPNVSRIMHMQKIMSKLDSVCAEKDEVCDEATAVKSRMWRTLRIWEDEAAKKLVHLAIQYRAAIIVDVPKDVSIRKLKEGGYVSERKVFLNLGHIRRRLKGLAAWYGVPLREERLYSTICPLCGRKMEELAGRYVRCVCGFTSHRDEVPPRWAIRRFSELTSFSSTVMA